LFNEYPSYTKMVDDYEEIIFKVIGGKQ